MKSELRVSDIEKAIKAVKNYVQLVYINGQLYWLFDKEGKPMASLRRSKPKIKKPRVALGKTAGLSVPGVPASLTGGMGGVGVGVPRGMGGLGVTRSRKRPI